jgi:hypothetical protein
MDLSARLENWGRGVRHYRGSGKAFSLEGNYRSPQNWHELPPPKSGPYLNQFDAWTVEMAWTTLCKPETFKYSMVLRYHYCSKLPPGTICKLVRDARQGRITDYEATLGMAHAEIDKALGHTLLQNRNILRNAVRQILAMVSEEGYSVPTT